MNAKVKVLRNVLQSVINDIDNGKYDRTDAEIDAAIEVLLSIRQQLIPCGEILMLRLVL